MFPESCVVQKLALTRDGSFEGFGAPDILKATIAIIDRQRLGPEETESLANRYLHTHEQQRRLSFEFPQRRDSFTIGRLAAKLALKCHLDDVSPHDIAIGSGVFHQPIIMGTSVGCCELGVSISHSDEICVAVIHHKGHPIGVDVEQLAEADIVPVLNDVDASLRQQFFELSLNEYEAASILWCARESLGKVLTTGMTMPPKLYEPTSVSEVVAGVRLSYKTFTQYQTQVMPIDKAWLAITLPAQTKIDFGWLEALSSWRASTIYPGRI
ncbi:4'-phosphopantetheinyl transferase family protein [Thalassospira sp. MIT121401]|uniref:4'-phosphopantetheinyl transferase family protein n=1 Tax=Thalassospira sp. MIT121401 TaxID=3096989 RepID=UPI003999DA42